jgi:hypothetical protein
MKMCYRAPHATGLEVGVTLVLRPCIGERPGRRAAQRTVAPHDDAEARKGVLSF